MAEDYAQRLERAEQLLHEVVRLLGEARELRPAVRVVYTDTDGWQPPPYPTHNCTDECEEATPARAGVCVLNAGELEYAHRVAAERVQWLRRWFPLTEGSTDG